MALAHGEILTISELTGAMNGKSVRTWGKLLSVDNSNPDHPLARIEYNQKQLQVSTEFIDASFAFRVGSMLQFIGELSVSSKGELVLRARVARCIDGMDLNLYEQALQLMRAHVRSAQPMAMDV